MEIRHFTKENIEKLYLSPYAEVVRAANTISFRNTLFMDPITIPVASEMQIKTLQQLDNGLTILQCVETIKDCLIGSNVPQKEHQTHELEQMAWWILKQMMVRGILE